MKIFSENFFENYFFGNFFFENIFFAKNIFQKKFSPKKTRRDVGEMEWGEIREEGGVRKWNLYRKVKKYFWFHSIIKSNISVKNQILFYSSYISSSIPFYFTYIKPNRPLIPFLSRLLAFSLIVISSSGQNLTVAQPAKETW